MRARVLRDATALTFVLVALHATADLSAGSTGR